MFYESCMRVSFNEISVFKESKKMKWITYLIRFVTECEFYTWFYDIKILFSHGAVRLFNIYFSNF